MRLRCRLNRVDSKLRLAVALVAEHVERCSTASRHLAQANGPSGLACPILQERLRLPITEVARLVLFIDHIKTLLEVPTSDRRRAIDVYLFGRAGEGRCTAHNSDHFRLRVELGRPDLDLAVGCRVRPGVVNEIDCGRQLLQTISKCMCL